MQLQKDPHGHYLRENELQAMLFEELDRNHILDDG